ncbi:hypothetical protein CJ030_MR8G007349 [Morella rubra]|uniref:Disease resistance protein At4g27190-like leucine-rich repeats domain-containing protein n=1 Tax=Morella rubra TaxID=262757 RepID=A0A6A1UPN9_9ROSI|nr:hypothetical protein CJ030_MR8G007349 [Morella rubra]
MGAVTATQLKTLKLTGLPKLKHIWEKDPEGTFNFQNLQTVTLVGCESLQSVFPASVSGKLKQLEFLGLDNCGVEVVIEKEGAQVAETLQFPKLTVLVLASLPKLKCFSPGMCPSEWPSLKKLKVYGCGQIEMFALTFQERQLEASVPLFVVDEEVEVKQNEVITFSNLAYLKLDCLAVLENFCSRSYSFNFPALEEVTMRQCPEMKIFCPGVLSTPKLKKVQATEEDQEGIGLRLT